MATFKKPVLAPGPERIDNMIYNPLAQTPTLVRWPYPAQRQTPRFAKMNSLAQIYDNQIYPSLDAEIQAEWETFYEYDWYYGYCEQT